MADKKTPEQIREEAAKAAKHAKAVGDADLAELADGNVEMATEIIERGGR